MIKSEKIGDFEVCINGLSLKVFCDGALWEEVSGDYSTEDEALKNYEIVKQYVRSWLIT